MKNINKLNALFFLIMAIVISSGCSTSVSYQTEEANKLVDQANKKLEEAKDLYSRTETRSTELFSAKVQTVQQLQQYKANKNGEAKSIVADYEKVSEMLKDVSKQYDQISRLNLNDKYKDYTKLKSEEFAKRAEAINIRKGNAQAFLEIDDYKMMTGKFAENNSKSDRLFKDAEDMAAKAKKMEEDNKDLIKQV